jgi:hypothetical protein
MAETDRARAFLGGDIAVDWECVEKACGLKLDAEERERLHDALVEAATALIVGRDYLLREKDLETLRRAVGAAERLLEEWRALPKGARSWIAHTFRAKLNHYHRSKRVEDDGRSEQVELFRRLGIKDPEPLLDFLGARLEWAYQYAKDGRKVYGRVGGSDKKKGGRPQAKCLPPVATAVAELWRRRTGKRVGSSRVDLQACKLEYSIVSPK